MILSGFRGCESYGCVLYLSYSSCDSPFPFFPSSWAWIIPAGKKSEGIYLQTWSGLGTKPIAVKEILKVYSWGSAFVLSCVLIYLAVGEILYGLCELISFRVLMLLACEQVHLWVLCACVKWTKRSGRRKSLMNWRHFLVSLPREIKCFKKIPYIYRWKCS